MMAQSSMMGSIAAECEDPGHVASTVRKLREMKAVAHCTQSGPQPMVWHCPYLR